MRDRSCVGETDDRAAKVPPGVPARAGVGLKGEHYDAILSGAPDLGFFEIHAENYMGAGGPPHRYLTAIRERYPLSLHGVGLSIGADAPLDRAHLMRLKVIAARYEPGLFSEHLAWSTHDGAYLNDLLPVPYDAPTLARVCDHIDEVQETMGRRMLLENPSTYVEFRSSTMSELDFLRAVVRRTGCGLLLDVNNVFVSAKNHNRDPNGYIDEFPVEDVGEIHLAGYAAQTDAGGAPLLIDAHGSPVVDEVWALYERALTRAGPKPTLIEWDNDVPAFEVLLAEAERAETMLHKETLRRNRRPQDRHAVGR
jgi:uncharacterized protein (UPF0276 family)